MSDNHLRNDGAAQSGSERTAVELGDIAFLRGARWSVNFGVDDASSPVALHHEGRLLVYLQIFLLKKTASASVRTMCVCVRACLHLQGHKVCDSCLNQNRSSSWE